MNITELDQFNIRDTLKFHNRLNPRLWDRSEHLHPEVQQALRAIADDFAEFLGIDDLDIQDITVSGSNAAYNYTPASDIDLHLVVDVPEMNQEVYRELFNAKKYQYNDQHNITIGDSDVELYVQLANEPHVSQGIYSVKDRRWISVPRRKRAKIDDSSVQHKYQDLAARIEQAINSGQERTMSTLIKKLKAMRTSGLEQHGEFGTDNLVFKLLRSQGLIQALYDAKMKAHSERLSIEEDEPEFTYAFGEDSYSSPDGVAPTTCMFLNEKEQDDQRLQEFFTYVVQRIQLNNSPKLIIHHDAEWSEQNASFGAYDPDRHVLHVSTHNRHIMDVMRTMSHELVHARQNELGKLHDESGSTGSAEENEANSLAGVLMRDWGRANPEMFSESTRRPPPREYVAPPPTARRQQYTQEYLDNLARTYSERHGVPLDMVKHVMNKETGWMPNPSDRAYAVSPKYASGVMQIMPQYHKQYGITDPYNPEQSMNAGTQMLRQHLDTFKDPKLALAAYNAGPTAVRKYGGVPPFPETQKYVQDYTPAPQPVKSMPEPAAPTMLDKITATGKDLARGAADWINRATAPAALDPKTMQPLKEKRFVPYRGGQPVDDPEINPLRDRLDRGEHPSRIEKDVRKGAGEDVKKIEHELAVQREVQRQLEREKVDLEKKLKQLKSQTQKEPEKERDVRDRIVDVINQITAPPRPFPGAFGADDVQKEDSNTAKPQEPTGSIQGGLNFLKQLQGLSRITRAGAEEELKGAVLDAVRAQSPGAPQNPSGQPVKESSGYIPTEREKTDPRFSMALTVDIKPGETGRQANKMALQTDSQGRPALLRASGKK